MTAIVVIVVAALSLTIAAQSRADTGVDQATVVNPRACNQILHITDTRIDGRTARGLRAGQPCQSRAQALQAMLSIWAVAGR
jgi:hypothetical protein